jgi:hypothetical protein
MSQLGQVRLCRLRPATVRFSFHSGHGAALPRTAAAGHLRTLALQQNRRDSWPIISSGRGFAYPSARKSGALRDNCQRDVPKSRYFSGSPSASEHCEVQSICVAGVTCKVIRAGNIKPE